MSFRESVTWSVVWVATALAFNYGFYLYAAGTFGRDLGAQLAFEFLKREFEENDESPGALQKQREWARKDPDLDALRSDPRFRELVGP